MASPVSPPSRAGLALEAVRDVTKQLVTVDAALLTFGVTYVQHAAKGVGSSNVILAAISALLLSLVAGGISLFAIVDQTHKATGTINGGWVRWPELTCLVAFAVGVAAIGIYVVQSPIG